MTPQPGDATNPREVGWKGPRGDTCRQKASSRGTVSRHQPEVRASAVTPGRCHTCKSRGSGPNMKEGPRAGRQRVDIMVRHRTWIGHWVNNARIPPLQTHRAAPRCPGCWSILPSAKPGSLLLLCGPGPATVETTGDLHTTGKLPQLSPTVHLFIFPVQPRQGLIFWVERPHRTSQAQTVPVQACLLPVNLGLELTDTRGMGAGTPGDKKGLCVLPISTQ